MATFPSIEPSFSVKKTSQPKTRTVKFQDGYEHRILFGLAAHQNPKTFSLTFKNLSETDSDTVETFLDDRAEDGASVAGCEARVGVGGRRAQPCLVAERAGVLLGDRTRRPRARSEPGAIDTQAGGGIARCDGAVRVRR